MKKIKILTVALLAIGLASAGIGCGSTSSGSSGNQVSSGVNALPPANLTVQNVGSAASQALKGADNPPPSNVSTVTSTTVNGSTSATIPTLSFLLKGIGSNNVIVKPQSMKGATVNALSMFRQAATSGSCTSPTYTDNSSTGNIDFTVTWNNATCSFSGSTMTIDGTITVIGTYDTSLGNLDLTETDNLKFTLDDPTTGVNEAVSLNGSNTITGAGVVAGTTSITYTEKGHTNINATITSPNGSGTITGWIDIDDSFTGTPSQLMYTFSDGSEIDSGSSKFGTYGVGSITMTTSGIPVSSMTLDGGGTYGVTASNGTSSYSGKVIVTYSAIVFDPSVCSGYPSSGSLTIQANNVYMFTFTGQTCGCAAVTENGTPTPNSPLCNF
ncbi:MAG: hypothetical protein M1591_02250 [Deltaproteobacteria bacterium]|nr:hypothetical protein [Deltaproteobacteria bacterium]